MTISKREYLKKPARREQILAAAMTMATDKGYSNLTRDGVAVTAGVAMGQVNHAFNTMAQLRRAVMRCAIQREILSIVGQGVALGDRVAIAAPDELKKRALASFVSSEG